MFNVNKEKCIGCSQCVKDCPVSAISLVDKESRIRYYLDSKMIKYYSNFFAKKIRRSKDDFWRDERFDQMSILMQDVRDDLLKNMSRYQRKMVKLARNHDLHQTQKLIAKQPLCFKNGAAVFYPVFILTEYLSSFMLLPDVFSFLTLKDFPASTPQISTDTAEWTPLQP